ncbi:MAG: cadmium-translocating P-type ATPase [Spirochaetales bacterium]|nr:cadmium-translocating P-type ATPase [Spirochaetales bacterium]
MHPSKAHHTEPSPLHERLYTFEGVDCPVCAAKIEDRIQRIGGVASARVDFSRKQIRINTTDKQQESFYSYLIKEAKRVEPSLKVKSLDNRSQNADDKLWVPLVRILVSVLSFTLAMLFDIPFLFILSFVTSGYDVLLKAARNIVHGKIFDENFLMSIATLGALGIGETGEAAAVMLFYLVGEYFQARSVLQSRKSIIEALDLKVQQARLIQGQSTTMVAVEEIVPGSHIRVLSGEKIPVDGYIVSGNSSLDMQHLTGESIPRTVKAGDEVLGSSINLGGTLDIRASKPYEESTAAKILQLVEESAGKKAQTERYITSFARYYTPIVVFLAVALAVIPSLITGSWQTWIYRSLVFLVVSCPCALVISVPLSYFAGIGKSAKRGILVKGGNYLEALAKTDTIVFDKTGTLTSGTFALVEVRLTASASQGEAYLQELAASLERNSNHPLAKAFLTLDAPYAALDIQEVAGKGLSALVDGRRVAAGNAALFEDLGIATQPGSDDEAAILLAVDGRHEASFILRDTLRPEAASAVEHLRDLGITHLAMISGDREVHANRVAAELGLDEVHASLLPHQKQERMLAISAERKNLVFVGDGMNDAPSLAASKVGIAMGSNASDAAMESADVVILADDLREVANLLEISRHTAAIVRQNIGFALLVKALALGLGAMGYASMWIAVLADTGVTIIAIFNALRILLFRPSR